MYLNCGERYEDMIYHCSCTHNLGSCEIKAREKVRPEREHVFVSFSAVQVYGLSYI